MNKYYADYKVIGYIREFFKADSDEEAIKLAKDGDTNTGYSEYLYECTEYEKTLNGDSFQVEVFSANDKKNNIFCNYEH